MFTVAHFQVIHIARALTSCFLVSSASAARSAAKAARWAGEAPPSTISVPITAVNDATVISPASAAATYTENAASLAIASTLTLSDVDSTQLQGATVSLGSSFKSGDVLAVSASLPGGIQAQWNGLGTLTLAGTASIADYQAALRSLTYASTSENPSTTARTVSIAVTDIAAGQTTLAAYGQYFNPDGTSAKVAYSPPAK